MIAKGEAYRNLGEIENAKQLLETILSNDPNNVSALNTYSLILISEDSQLNDAEKYIDKALVIQPQNPTLLATKAKFWFAKNNTNQALDLLDKAIQLDSKNVKYLNQKKLIYEYLRDEEKANKMKLKIENLHEEL
jgi:tetratricopeptide (TPR) repeat protein